MRVVCISDTHSRHEALRDRIPHGDVLVHAGDFSRTGDRDEVVAFNAFLGTLPHKYKLVIAGNHDTTFDRAFYPVFWKRFRHAEQHDPDEVRALLTNALYLEDQAVLIDGVKFYGSPWQPAFSIWAFNLSRGDELRRKWEQIPTDTDVLVTHGPPFGILDDVGSGNFQGCEELLAQVQTRVRPQLHVFGHIHEGHGASSDGTTTFANASICTVDYVPTNAPLAFDLDLAKLKQHVEPDAVAYAALFHAQQQQQQQQQLDASRSRG